MAEHLLPHTNSMIRRHPTAITVTTADILEYDDQKHLEEMAKHQQKAPENQKFEPPKPQKDHRSKEERLGIRN
ncbi:hypothetical protein CJU89_1924 [Yarrowia sp. B02]|nr:hypothetical protein CJU89_1924 [Yarrowia sp. B02]